MSFHKAAALTLTRALKEGRADVLIQEGIGSSILPPDLRQTFYFIQDHLFKYRKTPSLRTVRREFPDIKFPKATEPLPYYIKQLREVSFLKEFQIKLNDIQDAVNAGDKELAWRRYQETKKIEKFLKGGTDVVDLTSSDSIIDRRERYHIAEQDLDIGISTGLPSLDIELRGLHGGDYVVIVAKRQRKKTWFLLNMALACFKHGKRPLIISREMAEFVMSRRLDALMAGVDYDRFRKGKLSTEHRVKFLKALHRWLQSENRFYVAKELRDLYSIPTLVEKYKPDAIYIDAVYLFSTRERGQIWERMFYLNSFLKDLALDAHIPVVVTTQFSRAKSEDKADLDSIAYTDTFSQDADGIIKLSNAARRSFDNLSFVELLKQREGACDFKVGCLFDFEETGLIEKKLAREVPDDEESEQTDI